MKRRAVWMTPIVMAVTLPAHALTSEPASCYYGCDDWEKPDNPISKPIGDKPFTQSLEKIP